MKIKKIAFYLLLMVGYMPVIDSQIIPNQSDTSKMALVQIETSLGRILIRLENETPLHRDNFLKLIKQGFYDSLLFHRVINGFMIQGGDPYSKHAKAFVVLGDSDNNYTIPAEIRPNLFHQRGMLCAARNGDDVNPLHASSGCQFYITQGRGPLSDNDMLLYEYRINKKLRTHLKDSILQLPSNEKLAIRYQHYKKEKISDSLMLAEKQLDEKINPVYSKTPHYTFTAEQMEAYKKVGGTPHLDGSYTVFGAVLEGMQVVDRIAEVNTDSHDRPLSNIPMKIRIIRDYK